MKLARRLYEKIEKAGTPEEKIKGTEMERFYNDVPLKKSDFDAKLAALAPLEAWLICSNIKVFMALKTEDRRRILASVAGEIDMEEILKPFPLLVKAFNEKKTLEECLVSTPPLEGVRTEATVVDVCEDEFDRQCDWLILKEIIMKPFCHSVKAPGSRQSTIRRLLKR